MFDKLAAVEEKYVELSRQLGEPEIVLDPKRYQKLARAHADLEEIVEKYREYRSLEKSLEETRRLLREESDEELLRLAREELAELDQRIARCGEQLRLLLLPKDPNDERNVILEIRAGTGGDEATLFAQEVFRMYTRYAESRNWKVEILSVTHSAVGGFKEVIASISGDRVYSRLRFESGVQRVQRVPQTETQGRIHTSAITVAVLPEANEVEVQIDPNDLRIDTYCSSGPGGQSVNTTYSAVRITHLPTGEVVTCQDEKSQIKNKAKALKILRSRLYERAREEQQQEIAANRRSMVGSGDRSEKIRTYNFPQNRVTDHRINLTLHRLESVLEGDLDEIIDALITHYQAEALRRQALD
ncbi:MAG: peptide chain release factor 1 [Acidobacteriota bacterium]